MKHIIGALVVVSLCSTQKLASQDSSFIPTAQYDSETGNYAVTYWKDSTGKEYQTLFVPQTKVKPAIYASTSKAESLLIYRYAVVNGPGGKQTLMGFDLQTFTKLDTVILPYGWVCDRYRFESYLQFAHRKKTGNDILLGQSIQFFTMSRGLPGILKSRFRGRPETMGLSFVFEPGYQVQNLLDSLEFKVPGNHDVQLPTIGPVNPPSLLVPTAFLDTLNGYITQSRLLGWIHNQTTSIKYLGYFNAAKTNLQQNNTNAVRATLMQVLSDVNVDSTSNLTNEAYALIRYNTEYLLSQLPANPAPGLAVRLVNSGGASLTGGSLQYYEGSWKDAVNNNDGTFNVNTSLVTVSLRMTYAYGSQTKSNVAVNGAPVTFQTLSTQVKLQNSQGNLIDQGTVQYYAGAWRDFGTTTNGVATKELLPASYSFRMTHAYGSNDKQQDIGSNPAVVFQTVNAAVQLKNSQGTLIDAGTVQYYAGAWRDFGSTSNGVATKELLPNNYSFRMTYAFASKDKQQNIGTDPTVVFNTVNASVQLKNSLGNLIDAGTVQYYAGAWRNFGATTNGTATKELLANNYSFRMTYQFVSNDKAQDIGTNSTVSFPTVLCTVRVNNALGQAVDGAQVSYYSGAWRLIGPTVGGQITKELLPANLSFRVSSAGKTQDKAQNLSTNTIVEFTLQ